MIELTENFSIFTSITLCGKYLKNVAYFYSWMMYRFELYFSYNLPHIFKSMQRVSFLWQCRSLNWFVTFFSLLPQTI